MSCQFQRLQPRQFYRLTSNSSKPSQSQTTPDAIKRNNGSGNEDDFKPFPLRHPLGFAYPPQKGENTGKDSRTLGQRRADLVNEEKHLQRRSQL